MNLLSQFVSANETTFQKLTKTKHKKFHDVSIGIAELKRGQTFREFCVSPLKNLLLSKRIKA